MTKYNVSLAQAESFINDYIERGGMIAAACDGVLGLGTIILQGAGLRNFVVTEIYKNEWTSGHQILNYYDKPVPAKYYKAIEQAGGEIYA